MSALFRPLVFLVFRCVVSITVILFFASQWMPFAFQSSRTPDVYFTADGVVVVNGNATRRWATFSRISDKQRLKYWDKTPDVLSYEKLMPGIHLWYAAWTGRISRIGFRWPLLLPATIATYTLMSWLWRPTADVAAVELTKE